MLEMEGRCNERRRRRRAEKEKEDDRDGALVNQKRGSSLLACPKSITSSTSLRTSPPAQFTRAGLGETEQSLRPRRKGRAADVTW